MVEHEVDIRDGDLIRPDKKMIKVKIIDMGEGLAVGQPSNHDRILVVYENEKEDKQ